MVASVILLIRIINEIKKKKDKIVKTKTAGIKKNRWSHIEYNLG